MTTTTDPADLGAAAARTERANEIRARLAELKKEEKHLKLSSDRRRHASWHRLRWLPDRVRSPSVENRSRHGDS
jgi:hypothetical protein